MKTLLYLMAGLYLSAMAACGHTKEAKTLAGYVNDPSNGLLRKTELNNNLIAVQLMPTDMQVLAELNWDAGKITPATLKEHRAKFDQYLYFRFTLVNESLELNPDQQQVLSFGMEGSWRLISQQNDTLPCAFYQRIATGSRFRQEYVVVFDRAEAGKKDFRFEYADQVFGISNVAFPFFQKDIDNIPQI